jgi:hypothetical protein
VEQHAVRLDEGADLRRTHPEHLVKYRDEDAEGVIAQDGRPRDAREVAILGHGNREAVGIIDVQHDVHVRAPVPHVDDAVGWHLEPSPEFLEHRDLTVAGRHADNGANLAGFRVVIELGAVNAVALHDALERRLDDLPGRRGYDAEVKLVAFDSSFQEIYESRYRALEPQAPSRLDEVLAPHATEVGIVADEISELSTLLDEVAAGESIDLVIETMHTQKLGEHVTGVTEAQGLIEVRGEEIVSDRCWQVSLRGGCFLKRSRKLPDRRC